jgi:GNAT superfamily N-acetyltransferase
MEGTVRRGTLGDVHALVQLHGACAPATLEACFLSPAPVMSAEVATELLLPADGFSLVAEQSGALAGLISVAPTRSGSADVRLLVADAWQRRGIGSALLHSAVREAAQVGLDELHFKVHPTNTAVYPMISAAGLRARVSTRGGVTFVDIPLRMPARGRSTGA